jgi:hypothetical protein
MDVIVRKEAFANNKNKRMKMIIIGNAVSAITITVIGYDFGIWAKKYLFFTVSIVKRFIRIFPKRFRIRRINISVEQR